MSDADHFTVKFGDDREAFVVGTLEALEPHLAAVLEHIAVQIGV